jgi:hypothetical protein
MGVPMAAIMSFNHIKTTKTPADIIMLPKETFLTQQV